MRPGRHHQPGARPGLRYTGCIETPLAAGQRFTASRSARLNGMGTEIFEQLPGVRKVSHQSQDGFAVLEFILEKDDALGHVVNIMTDEDIHILNLQKHESTLEDVFVDLVGRSMEEVERSQKEDSERMNPSVLMRVPKSSGWALFIKTVNARAYPRLVGAFREKSWIFFEIFLPLLAVVCVRVHLPGAAGSGGIYRFCRRRRGDDRFLDEHLVEHVQPALLGKRTGQPGFVHHGAQLDDGNLARHGGGRPGYDPDPRPRYPRPRKLDLWRRIRCQQLLAVGAGLHPDDGGAVRYGHDVRLGVFYCSAGRPGIFPTWRRSRSSWSPDFTSQSKTWDFGSLSWLRSSLSPWAWTLCGSSLFPSGSDFRISAACRLRRLFCWF